MLNSISAMITLNYYLISFLLIYLLCFTPWTTTESEEQTLPTFYVENMAKLLFTNDLHLINNQEHRTKFRKPPEYMKNLFRLLNKAIANEEGNKVFDQVTPQRSDLKIQAIWPSKVLQTNSSVSFLYTKLNIDPPLQAQLVLKPRKTIDESTEKVKQQVLDVTENINRWFASRKDDSDPLHLAVHIEPRAETSVFTLYKGYLVLYYGIDHWQLLVASLRPSKNARRLSRRRISRQASDKCQLHEWYVNFDDLGWSSWVMAPSGFYANSCSGDCPSILMPEEYHASNHAMLRGIYRANQPESKVDSVNAACCVPTSLRATSLIYIDEGGITMRKLNNIIAEECGCQ